MNPAAWDAVRELRARFCGPNVVMRNTLYDFGEATQTVLRHADPQAESRRWQRAAALNDARRCRNLHANGIEVVPSRR